MFSQMIQNPPKIHFSLNTAEAIPFEKGLGPLFSITMQPSPEPASEPVKELVAAVSSDIITSGVPVELEAYYDISRKNYLIHNGKSWIRQSLADFIRRLRAAGYSAKREGPNNISQIDLEIIRVQNDQAISYAGPLAGYNAGVYEMGGVKVLVTESPKLFAPEPGAFPTLQAVFEAVLQDDDVAQLTTFYSWLKVALRALHTGILTPGQVIAFAGPAQCGKSLIQNLFTEMFGGRCAKPYSYMTGKTNFNSDLFLAAHLMIEDECATIKQSDRRKLGASFKEMTVNKTQRMHAKGKDALVLEPFWRVSVSLNDKPEDILVLPSLDDGTKDKVILMRAHKRELPIISEFSGDREAFWEALCSEIPAFSYWLINEFEIPEELRDERFGVKYLHHPMLVKELIDISDEHLLLDLIDRNLDLPLESNAKGIKEMLYEAVEQSKQLIPSDCKTGRLLGVLSEMPDSRVSKNKESSGNTYRIEPAA